MAIFADREAIKQLETLFAFLGAYGGLITTDDPMFWPLNLAVAETSATSKLVTLSMFKVIDTKVFFDPKFTLYLGMCHGEIESAQIKMYISQTCPVSTLVDEHDTAYYISMSSGGVGDIIDVDEKNPWGMAQRFSFFMKNITEAGPYLAKPISYFKYSNTYDTLCPFSCSTIKALHRWNLL